jgi:hypothetical protein
VTNSIGGGKKPPKKAELVWETTPDGFRVPSGAVNPMAKKRSRKWNPLDVKIGEYCDVQGYWPGGRPK